MIIFELLSIVLPFITAFLAIDMLWPKKSSSTSQFYIKAYLAICLGLGLSSYTCFIGLVWFSPPSKMIIIFAELLMFSVFCLIYYFRIKLGNESNPTEKNRNLSGTQSLFSTIYIFFIISLASSAILFILISLNNPHGFWDAWAIWNMRARFLVRSGDQIASAFSELLGWSHVDYPLLLPCNVAKIWTLLGNESLLVPILIAFIFTITTIGLLFSSLSYMQNWYQGLLAGLLLLTVGSFFEKGADQMADVPIGLYYLATIIIYCIFHFEHEKSLHYIFLAGIMAGFATWTKNEGILFLIIVILTRFLIRFPHGGLRNFLKEISVFLCGVTPIILLLILFKIKFAPSNDIISGQGFEVTLSRLFDINRYLVVGKSFISEFFDMLHERVIFIPLFIIFWGFSSNKQNRRGIQNTMYILSFMLVGYFMVYIITPHELNWHLKTSLGRLFLQLLPSATFLFFMAIANPNEVRARKNPFLQFWSDRTKK